jgi:hypothetical protein
MFVQQVLPKPDTSEVPLEQEPHPKTDAGVPATPDTIGMTAIH